MEHVVAQGDLLREDRQPAVYCSQTPTQHSLHTDTLEWQRGSIQPQVRVDHQVVDCPQMLAIGYAEFKAACCAESHIHRPVAQWGVLASERGRRLGIRVDDKESSLRRVHRAMSCQLDLNRRLRRDSVDESRFSWTGNRSGLVVQS